MDSDGNSHVYDMPVFGETKKRLVDGGELRRLFVLHKPDVIVIEQLGGRPLQDVGTIFTLGVMYGAVVAVAMSVGVRVELVSPNVWKRAFSLIGKSKEASRGLAIRLFPTCRDDLRLKKDEGRAEGLLLAEYGLRHLSS